MAGTSIVGDVINFRGLVYGPVNEMGVVALFSKISDDIGFIIEEVRAGFPDCIARRKINKGWERVEIEFEYKSSSFRLHGHDPEACDLIVCWQHDWDTCPVPVLSLKQYLANGQANVSSPLDVGRNKKDIGKPKPEGTPVADGRVTVRRYATVEEALASPPRKPQERILVFLWNAKEPQTRKQIAAGAPVDGPSCTEYIGSKKDAKRQANDLGPLGCSLITHGLVRRVVNDAAEKVIELTPEGRTVAEQLATVSR